MTEASPATTRLWRKLCLCHVLPSPGLSTEGAEVLRASDRDLKQFPPSGEEGPRGPGALEPAPLCSHTAGGWTQGIPGPRHP